MVLEVESSSSSKPDWPSLISSKRKSNFEKIPREWRLAPEYTTHLSQDSPVSVIDVPSRCGLLTTRELEITESYDATDLVSKLANRELKSADVVLAFCKRAAIAQQLVNCLTEIFFEAALERARELDAYLAENGKPKGPLHGLPISLKDSFNVEGVGTTIGYVSYLSRPPASYNSALVQILLDLGAVPYVKTNLPQSMMTADSENLVFGRTLNPHKLSLTAGGSTGGEGALLALKGSVLGVGTDIAGSVRIPALCNGIIGFKPSAGRFPFFGKTPPGRLGSPSAILPVIGPEGRSVRDMEMWMKVVVDAEPWRMDPNVTQLPWRRVKDRRDDVLRLGFIFEDKNRRLHPPMWRCMQSVWNKSRETGWYCVDLTEDVPSLWESSILAWKYFELDPQNTPLKIMEKGDETLVKSISMTVYKELENHKPSLDELFDMNVERAKVVRKYHDLIIKHELDAIVLPTYQSTAQPHDTYGVVPYTVLANLLNVSHSLSVLF
jgi:amidase